MIAELSASLGFESGEADLGYMIYSGLGVGRDREKGVGYLEKLANEGNTVALDYLRDIAKEGKQKDSN